ncbi:hypothetical protein C2857_002410 [Epichloe festucae Fl1]|uniref:Uncharacterized protein n=1 Tax=Epichloe festucae (strain Fl1) TaxID=877507 RepID=A0A7U3SN61_EPIFF|nr:hypothetical protein C2857_002410 [Epichloe festucae Fl1]
MNSNDPTSCRYCGQLNSSTIPQSECFGCAAPAHFEAAPHPLTALGLSPTETLSLLLLEDDDAELLERVCRSPVSRGRSADLKNECGYGTVDSDALLRWHVESFDFACASTAGTGSVVAASGSGSRSGPGPGLGPRGSGSQRKGVCLVGMVGLFALISAACVAIGILCVAR